MEYFKSGLKTVLGSADAGEQPTGADTVERLVERIASSTLLEDRRDACRALKALSKKYRLEVGAQGMTPLIQVLELDRADCETIGYALDTLVNITSARFPEEEGNPAITLNMGEQFTEIFIKNPDNVSLVLSYVEEYDFRVRWPAVKLLTSLSSHRARDVQDIVLVSPMGVSKLMDVIGDSREVIRNDMLILLMQLTASNANIQKIVAFENAFDRLFDIIKGEGGPDGGIVVQDCLIVMLNLLRNNTSNQQFFKEGSYIQRLSPMLMVSSDGDCENWPQQKATNIDYMLQIARSLVSPSNQTQVCASCQTAMKNCGLLENLCAILMAGGVPVDILAKTIITIGEVIRGNFVNQEYFGSIMAPSNPPSSAVVILLMSLVNDKQPFALRSAILYSFQCYLFKNENGQSQLVQTLLPKEPIVSGCTSGQLLCNGLLSDSALSMWFSSVAMMHCIIENPALKEQLLLVSLAPNIDSPQITLFNQCVVLVQRGQGGTLQGKIGLLMFLSAWTSHCPRAVDALFQIPGCIAYLIAQTIANEQNEDEYLLQGLCAFLIGICVQYNDDTHTDYNREKLSKLIVNRIGLETFVGKMSEVSRHEMYSRASKRPGVHATKERELLLDYEFCKLYKALEGVVIKTVTSLSDGNSTAMSELSLSERDSGLLAQYKNIIREQDVQLSQLRTQVQQFYTLNTVLQSQLDEAVNSNSQLRDQNTLLKAQLSAGNNGTNSQAQNNSNGHSPKISHESQRDRDEISAQELNVSLNSELIVLRNKLIEADMSVQEKTDLLERLAKDQEDLLELLTDQDIKLTAYKDKLIELGALENDNEELSDDGSVNIINSDETLLKQEMQDDKMSVVTTNLMSSPEHHNVTFY